MIALRGLLPLYLPSKGRVVHSSFLLTTHQARRLGLHRSCASSSDGRLREQRHVKTDSGTRLSPPSAGVCANVA